ncbi:ferritin-like domain-containing protein [Lactarius hatsudake]|nr:ferritin-like domain-containing protein [Lactarius hatsudake]
MRLSTASFLAAVVAPIAVSAAPFRRGPTKHLTRLQFAHVLEQLETQFYQQALAKFQPSDFTAAGFTSADIPAQQFTAIQSDEAAHVTALESIITSFGATPLSTCKFDFTSVLTDVTTMAPVARLVENVGVGAYLGAAHLVEDPVVLTAAASILTIEARHQTILNLFQGGSAIPQSFDIPLLPPGGSRYRRANFHCQMLVGGAPFSISLPLNQCVRPQRHQRTRRDLGDVGRPAAEQQRARTAGSNAIVAGPLMAFIDTKPESLGQLARQAGRYAPPSTTTVPPSQGELDPVQPPFHHAPAQHNAVIANGISMVSLPPPMTTSA